MREAAAKAALLEARVAEVGGAARPARGADAVAVALARREPGRRRSRRRSAWPCSRPRITGSAEPLVATLKQSDERLARYNQPRLEGVRRAIARDLDRVKAVSVADIATLTIKLDEAMRMVDELPLLSAAEPRRDACTRAAAAAASAPRRRRRRRSGAAAGAGAAGPGCRRVRRAGTLRSPSASGARCASLVRVTRIDQPEAMLLAPEQAFFLRENLKLRLLNARLALLSRQFDTAQADLQVAQAALDRYFDRSSRRTPGSAPS